MLQYDLELENAVQKIKLEASKFVCIQLPDGLKQYADKIVERIEKETSARVIIWGGSCYGACDIPIEVRQLGVDLIIQWGHSEWR